MSELEMKRLDVEIAKLMAETAKINKETSKVDKETLKLSREIFWYPVAIASAFIIAIGGIVKLVF
jgi:hypothetical protein